MKIVRHLPLAAAFLIPPVFPQEPPQEQPPAPAPAPRVVGEVRTVEEQQAWDALTAADQSAQAGLAKQFLRDNPESGMTALAHAIIAMDSYQNGDYPGFVMHGEEAIKELPQSVSLLAQLAFYFSETGDFDKAIARAQQLEQAFGSLQNNSQLSAGDFARTKDQAASAGAYALGRSYLGKYKEGGGADKALLRQAIGSLDSALEKNPVDDYAYYRLAEAYREQEDADKAIECYARAAALGRLEEPARSALENIFAALNRDQSEIQALIQSQVPYLRQQQAAKEQAYASLTPPAPAPPPS